MFYLTKLDEGLNSSGGSRDPLGLQPVWAFFGRKLIPSLTTVSTRSQHFSRLLVALYCRDRWLEQQPDSELRGAEPLLIFEELHAYSLRDEYADIGDTPGKRRVEVNWRDSARDPEIGHWPRQQILQNQAGVGISGRYFTPLVRMEIVDKDGQLAPDIAVEALFGPEVFTLQKAVIKLVAAIEESGKPATFKNFRKGDRQVMRRLLPLDGHVNREEVEFWRKRIGIAGDRHALVRRCAEHLRQIPTDERYVARTVINHILDDELNTEDRRVVENISDCEAYIAPLQKLFDELYKSKNIQSFEGSSKTRVWREQLKKAWHRFLVLPVENGELQRRFQSLCRLEVEGGTTAFANSLLQHHGSVARSKGGTPWVALEGNTIRALNAAYVPWDWDESSWANNYYIESLRSVLHGLDQGGTR